MSFAGSILLWWLTAWLMLLGQVRRRVVLASGVITGIALTGYAASATVWMPGIVTRNQAQYGFFGVSLALVTWFSGAAICIVVGACAAPVLAEDRGRIGDWVRGRSPSVLEPGAAPPLPPPPKRPGLAEAFRASEDDEAAGCAIPPTQTSSRWGATTPWPRRITCSAVARPIPARAATAAPRPARPRPPRASSSTSCTLLNHRHDDAPSRSVGSCG